MICLPLLTIYTVPAFLPLFDNRIFLLRSFTLLVRSHYHYVKPLVHLLGPFSWRKLGPKWHLVFEILLREAASVLRS